MAVQPIPASDSTTRAASPTRRTPFSLRSRRTHAGAVHEPPPRPLFGPSSPPPRPSSPARSRGCKEEARTFNHQPGLDPTARAGHQGHWDAAESLSVWQGVGPHAQLSRLDRRHDDARGRHLPSCHSSASSLIRICCPDRLPRPRVLLTPARGHALVGWFEVRLGSLVPETCVSYTTYTTALIRSTAVVRVHSIADYPYFTILKRIVA